MNRSPQPYIDSYFAGVGIGLVLLASYVLVGHGLGASGAFASVVAAGTAIVEGSSRAGASQAVAPYLPNGLMSPFRDWLVLELAGAMLGGWLSAFFAGRARIAVERGPGIGTTTRMVAAVAGGVLMGLGAKLARGCTSGQALTGGALLSAGSWMFIGSCFLAGYVLAPFARRLWR
ncbi:MAG TPA: YeeE/YedE thiosulfate transporter family protein [Bryobacteraceae bacterium]|nr:YeeE/YedE thiosulfate transporter family protein [Bryobacteraceae bacterium]